MAGNTILIVDDERSVAMLINCTLQEAGYVVSGIASTAREAFDHAAVERPDLVLMDIGLGGEADGVEAARRIYFALDIPVIFLTGLMDDETFERARDAQPVGFLLKPFEPRSLRDAIEVGLDQYRRQRQATEALLQSSEVRYRAIFEDAVEGILLTVPSGKIIAANPAAARMLGYESADELMTLVAEVDSSLCAEPARWRELLRLLGEHRSVTNFQTGFRRKDGGELWVSISALVKKDARDRILYYEALFQDISLQKKNADALKESETRLQSIVNSAQDGIIMIDDEARVTLWSPSAQRIFGYRAEEVVGRNLHDLLVPEPLLKSHQAAFPSWATSGEGCAVGRTLELPAIRRDGEQISIELSLSSLRLNGRWAAVGIVRDISERKLAERKLRDSERLNRTLLDALPLRVLYKDRDSRFLSVNRLFAEDFGLKPEDFVGKSDYDFFPHEMASKFVADDQRIMAARKPSTFEESNIVLGRERFVEVTKVPVLDGSGEVAGLLGVFSDITARKEAESARAALEVQLRRAQKLEAVGSLAAGIAHEINTPTQYVGDNVRFLKDAFADIGKALDAYSRLLGAGKGGSLSGDLIAEVESELQAIDLDYLAEEIPKAIDQTLEGVGRIAAIVRAMKEFAHPGVQEKTATDIHRLIDNTLIVCRNEYKYVADVRTEFDRSLPLIPCLPGDLSQVMLNLIVNAAHAIKEALGPDSAQKGTIVISTRRQNGSAEIRVSDTGTGIAPEVRSRIFDPFFTTKEVGKGTGQGLAIAHSVIVGKHGGTIDFESEVGRGTVFIIRLPLEQQST